MSKGKTIPEQSRGNTSPKDTDIHTILSNQRRRDIIELLTETSDGMTLRELSERIAEREIGEIPAPRNARQSVYVSIIQTHIPKMEDVGVVDLDESSKTVTLTDQAEEVRNYMSKEHALTSTPAKFYIGSSLVGIILIIAHESGAPLISNLSILTWAVLVFTFVAAFSGRQILKRQ